MKEYGREGIPNCMRSILWSEIAQSCKVVPKEFKSNKQKWFMSLLHKDLDKDNIFCIYKDITRTLPQHVLFANKYGERVLYSVLKAIALKMRKDTGYVQGMNYLSAMLLAYLTPEESMCMVLTILNKYQMKEYFTVGMPQLLWSFYCLQKLIEKYLPRVHEKFIEVGFLPSMYSSQWFITIFVVDFPIETVVRIWDVFFIEGRKIIYKIALAAFTLMEQSLLQGDV